jgi:hypothetical protein
MWLTGFDAPSCSTIYIDKPMRNHTLMQTIARANRVFPGKHSGVIVDYANVFASLEKALAIYGAGKDGKSPVKDKQKLADDLRSAMAGATAYCMAHNVAIAEIEQLTAGGLEQLQRIEDALNVLIAPDTVRRDFFALERLVATLYCAVKPDPSALEFAGRAACLATIAEAIRTKINPVPADISKVMGGINALLDESIAGIRIRDQGPPVPPYEIQLFQIGCDTAGCRNPDYRSWHISGDDILQQRQQGTLITIVIFLVLPKGTVIEALRHIDTFKRPEFWPVPICEWLVLTSQGFWLLTASFLLWREEGEAARSSRV